MLVGWMDKKPRLLGSVVQWPGLGRVHGRAIRRLALTCLAKPKPGVRSTVPGEKRGMRGDPDQSVMLTQGKLKTEVGQE